MLLKRLTAILILIVLAANLTACAGAKKETNRYEAEFLLLFDTLTRIIGYAESEEEFSGYAELIHDSLEEYHQLYDIYHDYEGINNIKTINEQAGIAPVKVDQRIIDLLLFAKEAYELTGGENNVALGAVLRIWHEYREAGIEDPERAELPPAEQLQEAAKHTDINQVIIDEENSTVFLEDPAMSLDVGAIAKGYAVEQVAKIAEKNGITSCLISVGGNVRAIGARGDGTPWKVGIQNPFDQGGEDVSRIDLTEASLVTSGIYERYYTVDGKDYHHIIDPDTLYPSEYFASVSVLCPDSGMADALTKIINMPFEEGLALVESLPDVEAVWVMPDKQVKYSSG
ncbi:MAG TPA: FAD:protein FMN transferase, partial [Anaerovoracaceae bacterium]|nr:FAD:protein FMN transferase [Anaerovoracaceae bacterium]